MWKRSLFCVWISQRIKVWQQTRTTSRCFPPLLKLKCFLLRETLLLIVMNTQSTRFLPDGKLLNLRDAIAWDPTHSFASNSTNKTTISWLFVIQIFSPSGLNTLNKNQVSVSCEDELKFWVVVFYSKKLFKIVSDTSKD